MEGLYLLKEILEEGDYLCKLDLQDDFLCLYTWKICEVSMERHTVQVSGTCDNGQWHYNTMTQWQWQYTEVESATYKEPEVLRNGTRLCGDDSNVPKQEDGIDFQVRSNFLQVEEVTVRAM